METEEEMIQRLIKEGLTKTETEEERVERLVKEEITRGETNKKWETKKRQALAGVSWNNIILLLFITIIIGYSSNKLGYTIGWLIAIIFFIVGVIIFSYTRNIIIKTWESPESYERCMHKKFE